MSLIFIARSFALVLLLLLTNYVIAQDFIEMLIESNKEKLCDNLKPLPEEACENLVRSASDSQQSGRYDAATLEKSITDQLTSDPAYGNSALSAAFGNKIPLALEFKTLDAKDGESVLGLSYSLVKNLKQTDITPSKHWKKSLAIDFNASGTATQNKAENPKNFLHTTFTLYGSYTTRIPPQDPGFGRKLSDYADIAAQCDADDPETQACKDADLLGASMLESTTEFLRAFQYYKFGIDAGYESDQNFSAQHQKISAFLFGQYESWGSNNSWINALGVAPAIRLAIDTIDPNEETPRAKAGDTSSYERISGEVSLWIPITSFNDMPVALTYNYRYYTELGASEIVKAANLKSYNLRTWSLTGTNGLFVSYSSGRLPFDLENDEVVELGWKTYF